MLRNRKGKIRGGRLVMFESSDTGEKLTGMVVGGKCGRKRYTVRLLGGRTVRINGNLLTRL